MSATPAPPVAGAEAEAARPRPAAPLAAVSLPDAPLATALGAAVSLGGAAEATRQARLQRMPAAPGAG
jgi:hypothetical protein